MRMRSIFSQVLIGRRQYLNSFKLLILFSLFLFLFTACGGGDGGGGNVGNTGNTPDNSSDTLPPSVPTNLSATAASSSQINLSWNAPTDNVGVSGYKVYNGTGTYLKSVTGTSTSMTGLNPSTSYCYKVSCYDAEQNESLQTDQQCATTLASSGGGGSYDECDNCLHACRGYPSCCTGDGCMCHDECN